MSGQKKILIAGASTIAPVAGGVGVATAMGPMTPSSHHRRSDRAGCGSRVCWRPLEWRLCHLPADKPAFRRPTDYRRRFPSFARACGSVSSRSRSTNRATDSRIRFRPSISAQKPESGPLT